MWSPHYLLHKKLTRALWTGALPTGCGYCSQCSAPNRHPYLSWDSLLAASGVVPLAPRIFMYEPLLKLSQPLRDLVMRFALNDTVHFGSEAFGGAVSQTPFPDCPQDREDCGLESSGWDRVVVNVTTVDTEFEKHRLNVLFLPPPFLLFNDS